MKRIGLLGFSGEGNIGDEAMLDGMSQWLRQRGHEPIVYAHGRNAACLDRYRRMGLAVRDSRDRRTVAGLDVLILGGGSLGPGFGWQLIPHALSAGVRLIGWGQSYSDEWLDPQIRTMTEAFIQRHTMILTRDEASVDVVIRLGVQPFRGTDPALLVGFEPQPRSNASILFVRACPSAQAREQAHIAQQAMAAMRDRGPVAIGCCCREDQRFTEDHLGGMGGERWLFTDPADCLRRISSARLVVTLRRLHPMILATAARTPCIVWPEGTDCKLARLAGDMGAAVARSVDDLRSALTTATVDDAVLPRLRDIEAESLLLLERTLAAQ